MQKKNYLRLRTSSLLFFLCLWSTLAIAQTLTAPFCESFDVNATPSNWQETGETWKHGPTTNGPDFPGFAASGVTEHTGNNGFWAGIDGSSPNQVSYLTSPDIDLTALTIPNLEFWMFSNNTTNTNSGNMTVSVEVSTNGGTTWVNEFSYSGNDPNWIRHYVDLSAYSGTIKIRMKVDHFTMSGNYWHNDIILDDICVQEAPLCIGPTASFSLVPDCVNGFSVNVNVTNMGDATNLDITDGMTSLATGVTTTGVINVGPFPNGTAVNLTLVHNIDNSCNLTEFGIKYIGCPLSETVPCGSVLNQSHCYIDNDQTTWTYTASNANAILTLTYISGEIDANDNVIIRDGANSSAPILFSGSNGSDLTGITVSSTGPNLFLDLTANGTNSCGSGATCCTNPWNWELECVGGCIFPEGTATYDCITDEVTLNITNAGSPVGSFSATIDGVGTSRTINSTGVYPAFGTFIPSETYSVVFDDGMGCATTTIPYVYGACRTTRNNCDSIFISNLDFESGSTSWNETATDASGINILSVINPIIGSEIPLQGMTSARLGGYGGVGADPGFIDTGAPYTTKVDRSFQDVTPGSLLTLRFWVLMDVCDSPSDVFELLIDGNVEYTLNGGSVECDDGKWHEVSIDVSAYSDNMSHSMVFMVVEQQNNDSSTKVYIDDIWFEDCTCPAQYLIPSVVNPGTPAYNGGYIAPGVWDFETNGPIISLQTINAGEIADYDSADCIELGSFNGTIFGFEVELGATFTAFIDGCNGGEGGEIFPLLEEDDTPAALVIEDDNTTKAKKEKEMTKEQEK